MRGLEAVAETDLGAQLDAGFAIPVRAAYTYTEAEFSTGFNSDYGPWGVVEAGDALPINPPDEERSARKEALEAKFGKKKKRGKKGRA